MRTCGLPTFDTTHIIQHRPRRHQSSLRGIPLNGHLEIHPFRVMVVVLDRYDRPLRDLRISVTDRCNLRCTYCMPSEIFGPEFPFLPRSEILTFEEITTIVDVARSMGVRKVRITGGEPLLRRDLPHLIRMIRDLSPDLDLALTTNGVLLARQLDELQRAGLSRVTVSLDALDAGTFERITDAGTSVGTVLDGIDAAVASGLPVKVNSVIRSGWNESEVLPLAARFKGTPVELRFIEFMDVGTTNGWRMDQVITGAMMRTWLTELGQLKPIGRIAATDVAQRWSWADGTGTIGFIESISNPFCGACSRMRVTADGHLHTCLFSAHGTDLRPTLRGEGDIESLIMDIWSARTDRYSEERGKVSSPAERVEMSFIGG